MKIAIIGDGGVGKTTLIKRIKDNYFEKQYLATTGHTIHSIELNNIVFHFYDYAGQEKYSGIEIEDSDFYIVMFDYSSKMSYKSINDWIRKIGDKPYIVVGNKCEIPEKKIEGNPLTHNISVKTGYGIEELITLIGLNKTT